MTFNIQYVKAHWYYFVPAFFGVFVVYELLKKMQAGSASPTDVSGGGHQLAALQASADLQNAQLFASTTHDEYAASVANTQTAAALKATEVTTAAQLDATLHQTEAAREIGLAQVSGVVEAQRIITGGQVAEVNSQVAGAVRISQDANALKLSQSKLVADQITQIQQHSKHASQDYTAFAPIVALETGQGGAAPSLGASNASTRIGGSGIA